MTVTPYDPRSAIEARADLVLAFDAVAGLMGGGLHARRGAVGVIVVDPRLDGPARRAVLTHELVHHERGDLVDHPDAPAGLVLLAAREERAVDDEVARRLVPADELVALARADDEACGVGPEEVAEHFDVPVSVARRAFDLLGIASVRDYSPPSPG